VRDPNNNTISMTYAGTNKLLQTLRSAAGRTTRFEHNNRGEAIKITDAASRDVLLDWDDAGRLSRLTDPLGNATAFAYNGRHQLTTVTGADGGMTRLGYDGSNRLQSVTDPLNQTLERYAYTAASRLSSRTDAFDRSVGYTYDERGRLIEMLDRRGQRLVLSYDAVGRITAIGRPDGTTNYRYDAVGRLIEIADGAGRIAIDYDSVDRPAKETHVQGDTIVTVEHVWDELDRRTQRRVSAVGPGGSLPVQTTDYTYDEGGRITRVTQNGLASTYTWDQDSRLTARTLPNGIAVAYSYDEVNQLTDITYRRTDGSLIERVSYQYDAAGRRIQKDTLVSPRVDETPIAATYDAGNRLTAVTLNPGGASPATYNLAYDGNGNLVERRNAADATDVTTYTWDSRNRLSAISAPGLSAAFVYDSLGRRIERTVTRAGEPAIVTRYVYDGLQAVGELRPQQGPVTEQTTALVTGTGLDEVLARVASGPNGVSPQTRVYVTDALSSALLLAREDQSIETTYGYSPYGQAFAGGADGSNSVQYTARENDRTGLLFFRARYYDPVLKRFVSEDPIGLAAGTNAYAYVEGDPLGYSDPLGLFSAADLPSVPQWLVDGAAGFGDTLSFGLTDWVRDQMGTNGVVDKCSGAYSAGEWAGIGVSVATGVAGGIRAAGARGAGREFSHWIPNRMAGPRSIWNGNYVSTEVHALSDPYRYRFMPRDWKAANPMPSRANQQWVRIPNAYKGAGAGGAYGAGGAAMNNCTCP
jgi:RHS repeat-associated protein